MIVEVLRPVSGLDAQVGDVVDATDWRNTQQLIRARYLRPVEDEVQED